MKPLKLAIAVFAVAVFTCSNVLIGQTVNLYPKVTVTDDVAWCVNKPVTGDIIYHLTYHLDKKTGFADRMHANVLHAELYDSETGEKYLYIDTGNDDSGVSWSFWNETTMGGTNTFVYDQQSYQVPIGTLPSKGGNVWAAFQVISKGGEKFTIHSVTRFIINPDGEAEVVSNKENIDCNE
jgi:hypothetical protein